ncbi:WDYHV1 (predicted) [Pycnogonum litorale]
MEMKDFTELHVKRDNCIYTNCFCEENVYKLCEYVKETSKELLCYCNVVFVSNFKQKVPLWKQKAGEVANDGLVVWDYHVIMIYYVPSSGKVAQVYDFDSTLSFPCQFDLYSKETFRPRFPLKEQYQRKFRIISGNDYLRKFSSDRLHMRNEDGSWVKAPPPYPPILSSDGSVTLLRFIDMRSDNDLGEVIVLNELVERMSCEGEAS